MAIDAAVADIERAGDVHDRRLREPVTPQYVFGHLQNPFGGQNHDFVHAHTCETIGRVVIQSLQIMMRFRIMISSLFEHDLFGKPVSTFPGHAPAG